MNKLLQRYIEGNCTQQEREEVMKWLEESPEHMYEFRVRRKLCDISLWSDDVNSALSKRGNKRFSLKYSIREVMKVAAVFLLASTLTYLLLQKEAVSPQMQTIYVPDGQRVEFSLVDGTKIWLNSGSTLRFPERFSENSRNVELDGEGYFDVTHQEDRPFTVETSQFDINVLGTEFNVKAYTANGGFEAALLSGSIEVSSPQMAKNVVLKPNELLSLESNQLVKGSINNHSYFRWREGIISVEDEPVAKFIEKLELYYGLDIEVRHNEFLSHRYTGKFRVSDGVEHVLKVLQLKHKFKYKIDEDRTKIVIE